MPLIKTILAITLFLTAQYSFAACDTVRCTGKVSFIFVNENDIRVLMDQDMSTLNCTLSAGYYATLQTTHPLIEEMFKTLLAGHVSQNPEMSIRIAEGSERCDIMYVTSRL